MKILNNLFNKNNMINQDKTNNLFEKPKVMGSSLDQIIKSSSVKPEKGLKEALRALKNENIKIDNSTVSEVNGFLKNAPGSLDSKLETIDYAAKKGVDITEKNLTSMQSAINESVNTGELIQTLSGTKDADLKGEGAIKKVDEMDLPEEIKTKLKKELSDGKTLKESVSNVLSDKLNVEIKIENGAVLIKSPQNDRFINLKDMIKILKSVDSILNKFGQKGMQMIKNLLASDASGENVMRALNFIENSNLSLEDIEAQISELINPKESEEVPILEDSKESVSSLKDEAKRSDETRISNESSIESETVDKSENVSEIMLEKLEDILSEINEDMEDKNLILDELTSLIEGGSNIKLFVVKEITQKIIDVKAEFSDFQKDMRNTIDDVLIEPGKIKEVSKQEIAELISKATQKLDDVIMKSDITLYTSMKGERDLVKMSSDLADARNMIQKGDVKGALNIIKSVRSKIENMKFNPSITKVEAHVRDKANSLIDLNNQNYAMTKENISPSGRGVLELMRSLGLNHEYEVSEKLHHDLLKEDSAIKDNAKMALLKIMQDKSDSKTAVESVEKSLNNLTGQQLLNRNNPSSEKQSLMFNIPIETPGEVKNLKLYVNGREKSNSLDWENCSLYFVIETKNYGMTGLKIDINDRNVNLTIRNDEEAIKRVAEPLIEEVLNEFTEIGLRAGTVNFRKLNLESKSSSASEKEKQNIDKEIPKSEKLVKEAKKSMEGFDFKI